MGLIPARAGSTEWTENPQNQQKGSSPRVRGAPAFVVGFRLLPGLIPARAGSTYSRWLTTRWVRAHPRACGEHPAVHHRRVIRGGSSPRVRGAQPSAPRATEATGLIPARAGSTPPGLVRSALVMGSSPRVRGALELVHVGGIGQGLIPARAGSTGSMSRAEKSSRAHPRACGEHAILAGSFVDEQGSSPRVRGALPPAGLVRSPQRAHPRACGEHEFFGFEGDLAGLIPARAGSTPLGAQPRCYPWAHPRACGEHVLPLMSRASP